MQNEVNYNNLKKAKNCQYDIESANIKINENAHNDVKPNIKQ